jgi:hypothetical protein
MCNVQPIEAAPPGNIGSGLAAVLGTRALGNDLPKLHNDLQGWSEDFERKGTAKLRVIKGLSGVLPSDEWLFELIRPCLDISDQFYLQNFREQDPHQTFAAFFTTLKQRYGVDPTRQNRKNWQDLALQQRGGRLHLQEWNLYKEQVFCIGSMLKIGLMRKNIMS